MADLQRRREQAEASAHVQTPGQVTGIALGTNVVIAYAVGHGNREDVQKAVHTSVLVAVIGGVLVALVGELAAAPVLGLLNVPEDVFPLALLYEVMSGYLRGFGLSLAPALLIMAGVCGVRIMWVRLVFPRYSTFQTIMMAYPISLITTTLLIFIALLYYRPAKRFARMEEPL